MPGRLALRDTPLRRVRRLIAQAAGLTALFMAVLGTIGYVTKRDLSAIGRISFIGLIALLLFIATMIASVYHADADENHGPFRGTGQEFAAMLVPLMDQAPGVGGHHVTNILIDLNEGGTAANAESYFIAFHPLDDGQRAFVTGRYIDRFEQRGGAWKIAQRHVIIVPTRRRAGPWRWRATPAVAAAQMISRTDG